MYSEPCLEFSIVFPNWCIQESLFSHHLPYQWNHDFLLKLFNFLGQCFSEKLMFLSTSSVLKLDHRSQNVSTEADGTPSEFGIIMKKKSKKLNGDMT